jgi:hypothetical protein
MKTLLFALIILVGAVAFVSHAEAQNYPWCALYMGPNAGATNCGFSTFQQCMTNVSGIGGFCQLNNLFVPPAGPHSQAQRRSHKQI